MDSRAREELRKEKTVPIRTNPMAIIEANSCRERHQSFNAWKSALARSINSRARLFTLSISAAFKLE